MDQVDFEKEMVDDTISRKIEDELNIQRNKRKDFGINRCQQNVLILEDILLPKSTGFYNEEMKLLTQNIISSIHYRLAHEELKQECIESVKAACSSIDNRILQFYCQEVEDALDKSFQQFYNEQNNDEMQTARAKLMVEKSRNNYNEKMKTVTQDRISPAELQLVHANLKEECMKAVKAHYSEDKQNCFQLKVLLEELEAFLEKDFELYKSNNEKMMKTFMAKVNLMVKKAHDNYIHEMSSKLKQKTMVQQEIEDLHKAVLNEASVILKTDLMAYQEDSDTHIQELEVLTKHNFEFFVEENQKRIREEEELAESEKREEPKQEPMEMAKERTEALEKLPNSSKSSIPKDKTSKRLSTNTAYLLQNCKSFRSIGIKSQTQREINKVPTIAVEFGMRTVKVGVMLDGKFTIIPDRWGNTEFPNTVTFTNGDEILIGNEVSKSAHGVKYTADISKNFNRPSDKLWNEKIHFRGKDILITKELLCGLILSRVKTDAEVFLKSKLESVVLAVPSSFTYSQQNAVKDVAIMAGFSTADCFTKSRAAAMAYAQQKCTMNSDNNFLVIEADNDNNGKLEALVYRSKSKLELPEEWVTSDRISHHEIPTKLRTYLEGAEEAFFEEIQEIIIKYFLKKYVENKNITEFALIGCEGEEKSRILRVVNELCKNTGQTLHPILDEAVLMGTAIYAELSRPRYVHTGDKICL